MKEAAIVELEQHATEELNHALLLTGRIIQLGGTPITKPADWYKMTNCGYDAPDDPFIRVILEQNIKGEQCAMVFTRTCWRDTAGGSGYLQHSAADTGAGG